MPEHPAITRAREIAWVTEWRGDMRVNMTRVVGAARTLAKAYDAINQALQHSPFDIAPCRSCGRPVVCLPDGMPCCNDCGAPE